MSFERRGRPKKFARGDALLGVVDVLACILQGEYLWVRYKPMHPSVVENWTLRSIRLMVENGSFYTVTIRPEWAEWEQSQIEERAA